MPYVAGQRVRIYYEVEGTGPPLVLFHNLAGSSQVWRDCGYLQALASGEWRDWGYTDAPRGGFRLVLIDARGHGRSEKPYQAEAYRVESLASDVLVVLDALKIARAHYWGYSLGAAVGFALAAQAHNRFQSLILGGYSPYGVRTETERRAAEWFSQTMAMAIERGMDSHVAAIEKASRPLPPGVRTRLLDNDARALFSLTRTFYRWPGVREMLSSLAAPCLVYAGAADPWHASVREGAEAMRGAQFLSLAGEDHFTALCNSQLVLPHALRFLHAATMQAVG